MLYKDFQGKQLSSLGLGLMRLPVLDKDETKIDMEKAAEMVDYAIENGINYFDTAYIYTGSESTIGEIFEKNNIV